jgi:hypothetical protein
MIGIKPHLPHVEGTFSYECMPFGLSNVGATFQRAMQICFDDLIGNIIQFYLDYLIVYSKNWLDHFGHLRKVLMHWQKIWHFFKSFQIYFRCHEGKTPRSYSF